MFDARKVTNQCVIWTWRSNGKGNKEINKYDRTGIEYL